MKQLLLIFSLLFFAVTARAQYNYSQFGFGVSGGIIRPYSDLRQNNNNNVFAGSLYYNYSPYLPIGLDIQIGTLSGGNNDTDPSHRYFTNNFKALSVHLDVQLGELIDYQDNWLLERIKGVYIGLGAGLISNNITSIRRYALDDPTYIFPGVDQSVNGWIPLRFGYEFKIYNSYDEPIMTLFFNYSHYLTFSEGLDGYNDPPTNFKNNAQDMARAISAGIKINFGGANTSYIKPIR